MRRERVREVSTVEWAGPKTPDGGHAIRQQPDAGQDGLDRRAFCRGLAGAAVACAATVSLRARPSSQNGEDALRLEYIVASCMFGRTALAEILPEVRRAGARNIDIWPEVHGNQREQIEAMGHEAFLELLDLHGVKVGILTQYPLGPFGLQDEMPVARRLGARMLVTGSTRAVRGEAADIKAAIRAFVEKLRPHLETAAEHGLTIAIENHANALIHSPDSLRWFHEIAPREHIGLALAPYHLPQDGEQLAALVRDLGERIVHFYAWQHGKGCHKKMPKEDELEQLPGRGPLDFAPILVALEKIRYRGWTEIFMHPFPRGIPILEPTERVTAEINRAREYLESRRRSG